MTNTLTTAQAAAELETDGRTLRKFLRSVTPKDEQPGKGSRWEIPGTKTHMNKMRKQFNEWSAKQAQEKADRAAAKVEEIEDSAEVELDD